MMKKSLWIADYTVEGIEDLFLIERKATPSELYLNIMTKDYVRFKKELVELNKVKHAFIICEFSLDDLLGFPWNNPKIPRRKKIRMKKGLDVYDRITLINAEFPNIQFLFGGKSAKKAAQAQIDRMIRLYKKKVLIHGD
jgi:hypothetical protein